MNKKELEALQRKNEKKPMNLLGKSVIIAIFFFIFYFVAEKLQIVPIPSLTTFHGFTSAESGLIFGIGFILILFGAMMAISIAKGGKR